MEKTSCWEDNSQDDEVLTAVLLRIQDFWDVTLCRWVTNSHHARSILNCLNLKGIAFLQNIRNHSSSYTVLQPRSHEFPRQVCHFDKKLPTVYDTWRFITIFTTSLPLCLLPSQINPFTPPHPIYLRPILTLMSHACLVQYVILSLPVVFNLYHPHRNQ
jgi:hypothetical protein